jgi:hypothetical protein
MLFVRNAATAREFHELRETPAPQSARRIVVMQIAILGVEVFH